MSSGLTELEKRTLLYLNFRGEASEEQLSMVRKAIDEVKSVARPVFTVKYYKIDDCPIDLNFDSLKTIFDKGGSDSVAFLVSTLGSAVDRRIDRLKDSDVRMRIRFSKKAHPTPNVLRASSFQMNSSALMDGEEYFFEHVEDISVDLSKDEIQLVRLSDYDFWGKVMSKFL